MKRQIGSRTEVQTDSDIAISVKNLHKSFNLPTEQAFGLKQAIFNRLRGIKGYKEQKVLRGLNFEIKKGEFIGIVIIPEDTNTVFCNLFILSTPFALNTI